MNILTKEGLLELISQGEGTKVEFKREFGDLKNALKTICAFLNTNGGFLIFGVDDRGVVVGVKVTDKEIRDIGNRIEDTIDPTPLSGLDINKFVVDGKTLLVLTVEAGNEFYHYGTIAYRRSFSQDFPVKYRDEIFIRRGRNAWNFTFNPVRSFTDITSKVKHLSLLILYTFIAVFKELGVFWSIVFISIPVFILGIHNTQINNEKEYKNIENRLIEAAQRRKQLDEQQTATNSGITSSHVASTSGQVNPK